jgi:hypothetical protein
MKNEPVTSKNGKEKRTGGFFFIVASRLGFLDRKDAREGRADIKRSVGKASTKLHARTAIVAAN